MEIYLMAVAYQSITEREAESHYVATLDQALATNNVKWLLPRIWLKSG